LFDTETRGQNGFELGQKLNNDLLSSSCNNYPQYLVHISLNASETSVVEFYRAAYTFTYANQKVTVYIKYFLLEEFFENLS